jgi:hypothetical protein
VWTGHWALEEEFDWQRGIVPLDLEPDLQTHIKTSILERRADIVKTADFTGNGQEYGEDAPRATKDLLIPRPDLGPDAFTQIRKGDVIPPELRESAEAASKSRSTAGKPSK